MATTIRPRRLNHLNMVLEDFDASVAHFCGTLGGELIMDMPGPASHAGLIALAEAIFEPFVPAVWLLTARYGPHFVGVEYAANMDEVRAAVAERGIRVVRDIGLALHTHPADTLGVAFEFYDGEFHGQTYPLIGGREMRSAAWWAGEHPLGLTGLKHYTLAVPELAPARQFLESFLGAEPAYEAPRPAAGARALGLRVADGIAELLAPTGPGAIADHLVRYGQGIHAAVFGVRSIAQVKAWCAAQGLPLVPGTAEGALAIPAEANQGVIFEFSE